MPSRQQLANAIRILSIDAVQKANSGHPGMPMGMADIAEVLWNDFLKHNPKDDAPFPELRKNRRVGGVVCTHATSQSKQPKRWDSLG